MKYIVYTLLLVAMSNYQPIFGALYHDNGDAETKHKLLLTIDSLCATAETATSQAQQRAKVAMQMPVVCKKNLFLVRHDYETAERNYALAVEGKRLFDNLENADALLRRHPHAQHAQVYRNMTLAEIEVFFMSLH